jgi:L-seryl-tRNA(Ser) seleniumtransferase
MSFTEKWNRRTFLGHLSALSAATFGPRRLFVNESKEIVARGAETVPVTGFGSTGNVYKELGVTTVINAVGTMTVLGGSILRPELEAVMAQAGRYFVPIVELEAAAGRRICEMLKLPAGYDAIVTSGAAAAMQSGLAGILTGNNPQFIEQIPDLTGMKSEVIIQKSHRNPFDHQLRNTGVKLVVIETREELKAAINAKTAMMHFSNFADDRGQIKMQEWVKLAHENNVPAFIDAAADTPPVSHLWDYANVGYDLIAFSGGKAIRGPQCAGLLIGKKEYVANALLNNSPHEDVIGRSQKVGKEEIVGMVKALELFLKEDHEALDREWRARLDYISAAISKIPGVSTSYPIPGIANHVPTMDIDWDEKRVSIKPQEVSAALKAATPSIVIGAGDNRKGLTMTSFMLQPGEEKIIAQKLTEVLKAHSA